MSASRADSADASRSFRDQHPDRTRRVPAYLPVVRADRVVPVFSVRFSARAGERRYIATTVIARQSRTTPDSLLLASVSLTCAPSASGVRTAGASRNVMRGRGTRLVARFVYVAPRSGPVVCRVSASGMRPRPVAVGYQSANVWQVGHDSRLWVSAVVPPWNRSVSTTRGSRVLGPGQGLVLRRVLPVGASATGFEVVADHKVTTCSAVGGSRDASTAGRELCAGRVSRAGTGLRLQIVARQEARPGSRCRAAATVISRRAWVGADVHHSMVSGSGRVPIGRAAGCLGSFAITSRLVHRTGADVVVHAPSYRGTIVSR
ncbi:hypothetical protein [Nocardioides jensenii]|uniref:hypothetical protein n=1 Tax=Nocardioides jensenii TaxID=1843 RepID=UPI00082FD1AE|nr:hypothetical protein [Nocardioides jensenii]